MRIGVVSDTHGKLTPELFEVFSEVDRIVHGGDVGPADLLDELSTLAPVTAVYGNTDGFDVRARCPQVARAEFDGFVVVVTHGDQFGTPTPARLRAAYPDADIIIYGHTHRATLELVDKTVTVMNPGSAGLAQGHRGPSVGILELEPGLPPRARIISLASTAQQ